MCTWLQAFQSLGKKGAGPWGRCRKPCLTCLFGIPFVARTLNSGVWAGVLSPVLEGSQRGFSSNPNTAPSGMEEGVTLLAVTQGSNPNLTSL